MANLTYAYSGNRLNSVLDAVGTNNEVDFVPRGNNAYTYYANGALKSDANEQISNIVYNTYVNQPTEVILTDGRKIKHYYDGSGALFKTEYFNASGAIFETYQYIGGIIYKNGAFFQIGIPEGRVIFSNGNWQYEFDYKDHLGNTRVSFKAENGSLIQTAKTDFDPWGVILKSSQGNVVPNRWEFLNREKEGTFNLNYIRLGARGYSPTIGRFDRIDPILQGQENLSPFQYGWNNPIKNSDPSGEYCVPCLTAVAGAIIGAGVNAYDQYKSGDLGLNAKSLGRIGTAALAGGIAGSGFGGIGVAVIASAGGEAADQLISTGKVDNLQKVAVNGFAAAVTGGGLKGAEAVAVKSGIVAATKSLISSNSTTTVVSNAGKVVLTSNSRQNISNVAATTKTVSESAGNIVSYVAGNRVSNAIKPQKEESQGSSQFSIDLLKTPKHIIPFKN